MSERQRLPNRRPSYTGKFLWISPSGATFKFFGTVSYFGPPSAPDLKRPAELFVDSAKTTSEMSYQVAEAAIYASMLMQHGVPLSDLIDSGPKLSDGRPATVVGYALTLIRDGKLLPPDLAARLASPGQGPALALLPGPQEPPTPAGS